jgi:hypothetical protein
MPIIVFRGIKTESKQIMIDLLIGKFQYSYFDLQLASEADEMEQIRLNQNKISYLLREGRIVMVNGFFFTQKIIDFFFKLLDTDENLTYILLRTDENNFSETFDFLDHEIKIKIEDNNSIEIAQKIHKIILTLLTIEYYAKQIHLTPKEDYKEKLLEKDPDFFETTSYILLLMPIYGITAMILDILKLYYIDNKRDKSLNLLLEVVKLVQVMGFNIRKGAIFYRVCYYEENANYTTLDQIWYPKLLTKDSRISGSNEPVLFVGEHWGSSFLEVHDEKIKKRPFIILEIEVIKPFKINYNGPINLENHPGASENNMYMDYCRDCRKLEPKLLALKAELLRNFMGEFWISNKHFDNLFTYDFTQNMSNLLLGRFKGEGLGYLSTQCNYQYNNFAIPASIADECLRPREVVLCDHTFWPNGRGSGPWIHFDRLKSGFVDLKTNKIIFNKDYKMPGH